MLPYFNRLAVSQTKDRTMRMHLYFLYFFLLALTPTLTRTAQTEPTELAETELKKHVPAEKTIRNLIGLKEALESNLLESEDGVWPCSDELFRKTAQLIISCYKLKQTIHSMQARIYIATLEDYVSALVQQPAHRLSRSTIIVKKLTDKALAEIAVATKTPLLHADEQTTVATLAFEKNITTTILFIKNQFLPSKPIVPKHETMLEKAQKTGRRAYNYVAETVQEYPFASGVVATVAILATAYWIKQKYFTKPKPAPGKQHTGASGGKQHDSNTSSLLPAQSISSPAQKDGKSCGYHSVANALTFARRLAAELKKKGPGEKLSPDEIETIVKTIEWPSREQIQDEDKAKFLEEMKATIRQLQKEQKKLNQEVAPEVLASMIIAMFQEKLAHDPRSMAAIQQDADLTTRIATLQKIANDGGCLDGQGIQYFIKFLKKQSSKEDDPMYEDVDEKHQLHWNTLDVGEAIDPRTGRSISSGEVLQSKRRLEVVQPLLAFLQEDPSNTQKLAIKIKALRNERGDFPVDSKGNVDGDQIIATTKDGKPITLGNALDCRDFSRDQDPTLNQLLRSFHAGKTLIINWREIGHWTCNIVVPQNAPSSQPKKTASPKLFIIDSIGGYPVTKFKELIASFSDTIPVDKSVAQQLFID